MVEQIENLAKNVALLAAVSLWIPLVLVWIVFAPLFTLFDVLNMARSPNYRSTEWRFCGVKLQANAAHAEAGGRTAP